MNMTHIINAYAMATWLVPVILVAVFGVIVIAVILLKRHVKFFQSDEKPKSDKEIASELDISVNTVNNHIANIFAKTEVRSRIDLLNLLQEASW